MHDAQNYSLSRDRHGKPFSPAQLWNLADQYGTPLWVYDAATIRERIAQLKAFDTVRFAQKACSNIHILQLMREQGVKVDAVSRGEVLRALAAGFTPGFGEPADIVFTADVMDEATLATVVEHKVPVNAGSIDMLHQLAAVSKGHHVWLRINPGFGHGHSNKTNTGGEHSKHGIWHSELKPRWTPSRPAAWCWPACICTSARAWTTAICRKSAAPWSSWSSAPRRRAWTCMRFPPAAACPSPTRWRCHHRHQPLPRPVGCGAQAGRSHRGPQLGLELEPGRFLVAESGVLLGTVRATKNAGSNHFVLVDTGFNELMRPSMYGSYHGMEVLRRDGQSLPAQDSVVAGPLCESGDVFTQGDGGVVLPRSLAGASVGDLLVIHDTGAYGSSMSSNYNTRPLAAEVLVDGGKAR
jgi:diaminopimelate decarboxylase